MDMWLVGDIGGTKTHLAIFEGKEKRSPLFEKKYPSRDYSGLTEIVRDFFSFSSIDPRKIAKSCFGVAGPVLDKCCKATNLPWFIQGPLLEKEMGLSRVELLNDLEANAYGIAMLEEKELLTLQNGKIKNGNQGLIAAGTGLGEACLFWDGKKHLPFASEGGHTDFGPRSELEMELFRYLKKQFKHVSYERLISGSGFYQLYRFLIDMHLEEEDPEIRKKIATEDPAHAITTAAIEGTCSVCLRCVRWFLSLYGAEAGNVALKFFSVGGIFVGGGIAPRLSSFLHYGDFIEGFLEKGRFRPLLEEIPIKVILNDNAVLLGALRYARDLM